MNQQQERNSYPASYQPVMNHSHERSVSFQTASSQPYSPGYPPNNVHDQRNAAYAPQDRGPASPTRSNQPPAKRVSFGNTPTNNQKPSPPMERINEDPNVSIMP